MFFFSRLGAVHSVQQMEKIRDIYASESSDRFEA